MPGFWTQKYIFKRVSLEILAIALNLKLKCSKPFQKIFWHANFGQNSRGAKFRHELDSGIVILAQSQQETKEKEIPEKGCFDPSIVFSGVSGF